MAVFMECYEISIKLISLIRIILIAKSIYLLSEDVYILTKNKKKKISKTDYV